MSFKEDAWTQPFSWKESVFETFVSIPNVSWEHHWCEQIVCSRIQNYCVTLSENLIEVLTISRGTLKLNFKRSEFPSFWRRRIIFLGATVALLLVFLLHVRRGCCSWWGTPTFLWVLHFRSNRQKLESSYIFCLFIWTAESSYWFYCWDINLNSNVQFKVVMAVPMKNALSSDMMP